MLLVELEPRWLSANVFTFRCPHCRNIWLTCKNVVLDRKAQLELVIAADLDPNGPSYGAVLMKEGVSWIWDTTDFSTMSVKPSLDASASGHWHGFITNGEITTA